MPRGRTPSGGLRISIGERSLAHAKSDPDPELLAVSDARCEPITVAVTICLALAGARSFTLARPFAGARPLA